MFACSKQVSCRGLNFICIRTDVVRSEGIYMMTRTQIETSTEVENILEIRSETEISIETCKFCRYTGHTFHRW